MEQNKDKASDLLRQRRENFQELVDLGVDPYPRRFERTHSVDELVQAYGATEAEALEAAQPRHVRRRPR